jgi:hypothetical protein
VLSDLFCALAKMGKTIAVPNPKMITNTKIKHQCNVRFCAIEKTSPSSDFLTNRNYSINKFPSRSNILNFSSIETFRKEFLN